MFSLTTNGTPTETEQAYALLAIIADPKLAQQRLDALAAEKADVVAAMEASADHLGEAKQLHDDAAAKLTEAQRVTDEFNGTHETRRAQLEQFSADLGTKQDQLKEWEARLTQHEAEIENDLKSREAAVQAREIDVTERETVAIKTGDAAQLLKEAYERKVSALQAALSPEPTVSHVLNADTGALGAPMGGAN